MQQLKLDEYARRLCAAKKAYDYPAVTCFDFDAFLQLKGRNILKKKGLYEKEHQNNMLEVEELIRGQLLSQDIEVVKDGLSNVLYWGYARRKGRQFDRVKIFRKGVTRDHLEKFAASLKEPYGIRLDDIQRINMPQFGKMIPFASKILMFLHPEKCPVLDNQIADFGKKFKVPGLNDLKTDTDTSIRSTSNTRVRYMQWARWCGHVAERVNSLPTSPCKDLRAVDVERAIYSSIPAKKDRNQDATQAMLLLAGPDIE